MLAEGLAAAGAAASGVPSVADVERRIPGFEILSVVGHGGMGVVYKARQKALDRVVALKVLPPAAAASPGFTERFAREAKALARLQHPHIVAVHDFGQSGDAAGGALCWLVMEYVDGMNVREAMRAGRIAPKDALAIVPQICDALQYAHDRGVVHRDIKPENVLIDRDGRVKVADFGLAKLASRDMGEVSLTGAQQVMGTVHYMAPEQWQHPKDVDHRADIYSLGVVFYEMLTGELPLGRFDPPSKRAVIDVRVDEVVMRSLEREREQRWQHVSEMKTKVDEIASAPRAEPPPVPVAAPAVAARTRDEGMEEAERNWPDTFTNAAVTGVVAVAFGVWAYFGEPAMWWAAGTIGVGAAIQAIYAASNRAKEARLTKPAAPSPAASAAEEEDIGARRSVGEVAILLLVSIGCAVAALATEGAGWWWGCGVAAFAAGVCAILLYEQNKRDAAAPPPRGRREAE
jgi:serine/threonine protein kinase